MSVSGLFFVEAHFTQVPDGLRRPTLRSAAESQSRVTAIAPAAGTVNLCSFQSVLVSPAVTEPVNRSTLEAAAAGTGCTPSAARATARTHRVTSNRLLVTTTIV